ncbi:putative c6 finger domain-containing protein [Diplodia seriata]|uniref:Putative c6 finger domain-containing protein n=1 Tax=Diplodia seriata TaxID=420778 RepID=A0A0G2GAP4_9PEZI|nr:putative c6 finger domain-containing protein [Diplodia seriata]
MSEPQSYPSPNAAQMAAGAAGLYAHPNGNMSPAEASSAVDPHLSLHSGQTLEQELSAQLRGAAEAPMPAQHQQPQHGLPMAHVGQVHTPVQQPSTPQQMAQNAMNMAQDPHYSQQDSNQRKREPFGTGYEHDAAGAFFEFSQNADVAVNEYYRVIQDTYPVLPFDLRNLKGRLANCDAKLRDAFTAAIDCAVRAWPSTSLAMEPNHQDRCYKAYQMLTSLVGTTVKPAGIILVQSFLLLTIEADVHGPRRSQTLSYPDNNDEALGRRLFWVLFIFDQLHAISTATTPSLSAERSHLTGDDETLFGPVTFALARLCKAMGGLPDYYRTLAEFPPTNNDVLALYDPNNAIMKMTKTAFLSSLERFSETLPSDPHPLILLAYFHVHLLIVRYTPGSEPGEILHDATAIVTHLQRHQALITTPHHHFAALAALTLGELAEKDETREESLRLLGELEGVLNRNKVEGDLGWDASVREYAGKKRSSINESNGGASSTMLEHLAEAAVGERRDSGSKASPSENRPGSSSGGGGADPPKDDISNAAAAAAAAVAAAASLNQSLHFNPANLVRDGYLNILAQVLNQQQPQQH